MKSGARPGLVTAAGVCGIRASSLRICASRATGALSAARAPTHARSSRLRPHARAAGGYSARERVMMLATTAGHRDDGN